MLADIIIESSGMLIAAGIGMVCYKRVNPFYRLLFIQLISWLLFYILSYIVTEYQKYNGGAQNNQWIFNLQILTETILLLLAAKLFFKIQVEKKMEVMCWIIFLGICVLWIVSKDIFVFNTAFYSFESILMIVIYSLIVFKCFYKEFASEASKTELWASIGLVLYFGCNLPYFSLFNFLNSHYLSMSETLHRHITDVFSNVRYILLAIGFLQVNKLPVTLNLNS